MTARRGVRDVIHVLFHLRPPPLSLSVAEISPETPDTPTVFSHLVFGLLAFTSARDYQTGLACIHGQQYPHQQTIKDALYQ